jgi:hypothetical protein
MANIKLIREIINICNECLLGIPTHSITHHKTINDAYFTWFLVLNTKVASNRFNVYILLVFQIYHCLDVEMNLMNIYSM